MMDISLKGKEQGMNDDKIVDRSMREGEGGVFTPHGYVMQESELRQAPSN